MRNYHRRLKPEIIWVFFCFFLTESKLFYSLSHTHSLLAVYLFGDYERLDLLGAIALKVSADKPAIFLHKQGKSFFFICNGYLLRLLHTPVLTPPHVTVRSSAPWAPPLCVHFCILSKGMMGCHLHYSLVFKPRQLAYGCGIKYPFTGAGAKFVLYHQQIQLTRA